ncbi:MAG: glycoside hydrolase family 13 protein [Muribaculaceae bacterium]|nr:glycoside hydrolase family 13 protein [Muribaculaceae bacterium]
MKKILLFVFLCLGICALKAKEVTASEIQHINPPSWWVDMKLPLQLMVNGNDISSYDVSIKDGDGVKVTNVHKAESPNYLFIDIEIPDDAKAGIYNLVFTKDGKSFEYPYEIAARRPDSSNRESFTTADLIYLIMPDRFANGDKSNDSTDDTNEKANRNSLGGRHGGDLQGIINNLDYIADLGATAIWNTPLLLDNDPRGSYHGYAASDYYLIDPRFGDNELFKEFVEKAHEKDLKVIMDVVTNHSGTHTYWWSDDLPFQDWIHQFPEYTGSNHANSAILDTNSSNIDKTLAEEGWFTPGMADMNLNNPYLLQFFKQWALWWIEFADLDGYRVDTYWYNEKEPMSQWNQAIIEEYPNFNIVGETWISQIPAIAYWQKDNNNHDGFNSNLPSVMDFPLLHAANSAFGKPNDAGENQGQRRGRHKNGARELYDVISQDYIYPNINNLLVFTSNHDTDRVGDIVGKDPDRFKAMMVLFATVRGIPQIFSGDEMMFSSVDPKTGHPGLRVDFPGGWEGDAFDFFTDEGRAAADVDFDGQPLKKGMRKELYDFSKNLFQWRKSSDIIHNGKTKHFIPTNEGYGYFRYNDNGTVFVFINTSDSETINVPWSHYSEISSQLGEGRNVLTGESITVSDDTQVAPMQTLVIEYLNQ